MESGLSAEQRRALAIIVTSGRNGLTRPLLTAHGFDASLIDNLVNKGLAMLMHEKVRVGGTLVDVAKVRITPAGRDALGES